MLQMDRIVQWTSQSNTREYGIWLSQNHFTWFETSVSTYVSLFHVYRPIHTHTLTHSPSPSPSLFAHSSAFVFKIYDIHLMFFRTIWFREHVSLYAPSNLPHLFSVLGRFIFIFVSFCPFRFHAIYLKLHWFMTLLVYYSVKSIQKESNTHIQIIYTWNSWSPHHRRYR